MKYLRLHKQKKDTGKSGFVVSSPKRIAFSIFVFLPLAAMIVMAIQTSHQGSGLVDIEKQIGEVMNENNELELNIVKQTSLMDLSEAAHEFGFETPVNVVYLNKESPVAKLQ